MTPQAKPLIAVVSCKRDRENGRQNAVHETWLRQWPFIDTLIVLGEGNLPVHAPNEFICSVPDDYNGVVHKFNAARRWALLGGYTHLFHACIDTWICVPRLMTSGFEQHDYTGYRCDEGHGSGGMGYWCSQKAIKVLLQEPVVGGAYEDLWVGHTLARNDIPLYEDRRYSSPANPNRPDNEITLHLSRGTDNYDPQWMYDAHKHFLETGNVK